MRAGNHHLFVEAKAKKIKILKRNSEIVCDMEEEGRGTKKQLLFGYSNR